MTTKKSLLLATFLSLFTLQNAAYAGGIPAWKMLKYSPLQGNCDVYVCNGKTKVHEQRSGMITIFDGNPEYFTAVNLEKKTYHREKYKDLNQMSTFLTSFSADFSPNRKWVKVPEHKKIAGQDCIGYKSFSKDKKVEGEAWYFSDRTCTSGDFLRQIFGVPTLPKELAEMVFYQNGQTKFGVKTLTVQKVTLAPTFFDIPKDCKKDSGRFGVMNGALEGIEGLADDIMGQESRQYHPKGETAQSSKNASSAKAKTQQNAKPNASPAADRFPF